MDSQDPNSISADLYFLIHKFLSGGPLTKTLEVFHNELLENKFLPQRTDFLGEKHERTIEDMDQQYSHVRPDYLLQLCCRAGVLNTFNTKNTDSLFRLKKSRTNSNNVEYNFRQLLNYVKRKHLLPVCSREQVNNNIVNILRGREISGSVSRKWIVAPKLYTSMHFQRRTLGHLSAVYCLLFDYSGQYIITGADDLLIKLWSSRTGRLIASFRGASSEITDIAINLENSLLAAGSIDRILRIWDLQTGAPLAVLTGHTGMITSVNFCPSASYHFLQYLVTTSTDGSVAFWVYTYETGGKVEFRSKPTMYQEKIRPGQAQMICSSFSPGGTFLATGSADHHVRVYYMKGDEGPHRILETEAHSDRVDSIQWAHEGLKFVTGSKDGTAIIWTFEAQQWKPQCLNLPSNEKSLNTKKPSDECRKLKVTMVAWDCSDQWLVTAISDFTLKIWNANTRKLDKILRGHTDEVYVLECHPHDRHVILSAGHDGQLFIWDLIKGEMISKFNNLIENQGYGAIFDAKWSPDGTIIAASDSNGHLLIFGFGSGHKLYEQLPKDLFFHTDYRPLVRDANNYVLDEQTQIPPHLLPPPFLVNIDGNPYPPMLQRLVPGRELCKAEHLMPSIILGHEGTQEVIQMTDELGHSHREQYEDGRNGQIMPRSRSEGIRQSTGEWQCDPNMKWKRNVLVRPLRNAHIRVIKEEVEMMETLEMQEYRRQLCQRPHMINTAPAAAQKSVDRKKAQLQQATVPRLRKTFVMKSSDSESEPETNSSGYSDWVVDENVNLESPKRRRQASYMSESENEIDKEENESQSDSAEHMTVKFEHVTAESSRCSDWLTETRPRKTPYVPQMGDELVYFPQGHLLYLEAVRGKKIYEINSKSLPWGKLQLRSHEFVKVVGIQWEVKPARLCNLRLALLDDDGRLNGRIFSVKYHDMPDVLDFFVLKQNFDVAVAREWTPGDRFRCMIDDRWWIGEIVTNNNVSEDFPNSPFLCYEIKWDTEETERLSPWDMEPIDDNRLPENPDDSLPVLEEEIQSVLYQPSPDDWPNNDRESVTNNILSGLTKVMELAIAEPFLVPVDLNAYPTYAAIVAYPVDLSIIKARFENHFYRRVTAAQFDIRHLATNAEKFNQRHSIIVKNARILTELCLRIIKQCTTGLDVTAVYHQLVDTYDSTDTEANAEIEPSGGRTLRSLPTRHLRDPNDWKTEANIMLQDIWDCDESEPFRAPVNLMKYADYKHVVKNPMDLSTVKENLLNDRYHTPLDLEKDMKLMLHNSRIYNTNQRSKIFSMTLHIAAIFQEHFDKLLRKWKMSKRRNFVSQGNNEESSVTASSATVITPDLSEIDEFKNEETSDSEDEKPLKKLQTEVAKVKSRESDDSSSESSDENTDSDSSEGSYKPSLRKRREIWSSDTDSDEPLSFHKRNKRRKTDSESDSEENQTTFHTSVSSRGRVRKLNPRVTALMKK